jgi:hypothetical protein
LPGNYGEEMPVGHGQIESLRWWKIANQNSERIRPRN